MVHVLTSIPVLTCVIASCRLQEKEGTSYRELSFVYVLPAIFCSLCMLIFNAFKWEDFQGEGFSEFNTSRARAFFMVGLIGMFLTMGFGIWVAQDKFIDTLYNDYGGVCIIINLILIFVAAVVLRVGTASS